MNKSISLIKCFNLILLSDNKVGKNMEEIDKDYEEYKAQKEKTRIRAERLEKHWDVEWITHTIKLKADVEAEMKSDKAFDIEMWGNINACANWENYRNLQEIKSKILLMRKLVDLINSGNRQFRILVGTKYDLEILHEDIIKTLNSMDMSISLALQPSLNSIKLFLDTLCNIERIDYREDDKRYENFSKKCDKILTVIEEIKEKYVFNPLFDQK